MKIIQGIISVGVFIFLCVTSEFVAGILIKKKMVGYYQPLDIIEQHADEEDWRLTMSLTDVDYEYDPVLFWKRKVSDINISDSTLATASCTFLVYGDSNVQGHDNSSWPGVLQQILQQKSSSVRVLNFGTAGYSSYQGVERYRKEASDYPHSIILASFGWNDVAPSMKISDKEFGKYLSSFMHNSSLLLTSNMFRIIKYYSDKITQQLSFASFSYAPRVSQEEYRENLKEFISIGRDNDSQIVFVTRPYITSWVTAPSDSLAYNWRPRVPGYNEEVIRVAHENQIPVIELQRLFEEVYDESYYIDDNHFTNIGYEKAAHIIATELENYGIRCKE
jgi:lysophospholipase L1-like esterase